MASLIFATLVAQLHVACCLGFKNNGPQTRIVNGQNAPKDRFPWFVRLLSGSPITNGVVSACGGSLIAPDLVITAAHCENPVNANVNPYVVDQVDTSLQRKVVAIFRHPNFPQELQVDYDVMIIKLESPITDVQPVHLNYDEGTPARSGEQLSILGFGSTIPGSSAPIVTSETLQIASTDYVSFEDCAVAEDPVTGYKNGVSTENTVVEPWWLCTLKSRPEVTATCFGDSGGPVIRQGSNPSSDLLVGVISGGSSFCGNEHVPSWNNRVSYFTDWITSVGCDLSDSPPTYWNCKGGGQGGGGGGGSGGGTDGEGNIGLVITVILVFIVLLVVGLFMWRRRKVRSPVAKNHELDEESPKPSGGCEEDSKLITTSPPSPFSSEAGGKDSQTLQRGNTDSECTSPLARRPSGLFNRKPSMECTEDEKASVLFGGKPSTGCPISPEKSDNGKRRPSMESKTNDRLPSLDSTNVTKEKGDSFVPKEIADMVDQLDKELGNVLGQDLKDTPFSELSRGRSKSADRFTPVGTRESRISRSPSVDRQGSTEFAARRGRGLSRNESVSKASRSRSTGRSQQLNHDVIKNRGRSNDFPLNMRESEEGRLRSKSREPAGMKCRRSISPEPRPRSSSALIGSSSSRPSHTGPKRNPPPRTRSDIVTPSKSNPTARPRRLEPRPAPPPRTKSDTAATSMPKHGERSINSPLACRNVSISPTNTKGRAIAPREPPSRTKSDIVSSAAAKNPTEAMERVRPGNRIKTPPPRTKSDPSAFFAKSSSNSSKDTPVGSPTRRSLCVAKSDGGSPPASNNRTSGNDSGFKGVIEQWKERDSSRPVATTHSDGTVTVTKARYNADGAKVTTKTNYASVELARRHGVDV
jgi:secreted trypsin-like serine protease